MNKLNTTLGLLIETVYFALKYYLLFIACIINTMTGSQNPLLLYIFAAVYLLFSLSGMFLTTESENNKNFKLFPLILIAAATAMLSVLGFVKHGIFYTLLGFIILCFIGYSAVKTKRDGIEESAELKKMIGITLISLICALLSGQDNPALSHEIYLTVFAYFLLSIIFLVRLNLAHAYEVTNMDFGGKNLNMTLINSFSILFAVIAAFLRNDIIGLTKKYGKLIFDVLVIMLELLINIFYFMFSWLFELVELILEFIKSLIHYNSTAMDGAGANGNFEYESSQTESLVFMKEILVVLIWLIMLYVVFLILRKVYRMLKESRASSSIDLEEKEFIFNKNELLNNALRRFKNIFTRELPSGIRLSYLKTVNLLIKKGYSIKRSTTPIEFETYISGEDKAAYGFTELTKAYIITRYGKTQDN